MAMLKDRKVFLEMCYSSNLQTRTVESPQRYPLPMFLEKGICATVNTDNMTVSDTDLKKEYLLLQREFLLSGSDLKRLALNAVAGAFVEEEERTDRKGFFPVAGASGNLFWYLLPYRGLGIIERKYGEGGKWGR